MSKKTENNINASDLLIFLKKVFINGTIPSCKITTYDDGLWVVDAIDPNGILITSVQKEILPGNEWDIGVGDISILIKYLTMVGNNDVSVNLDKNRFKLKSKKGNLNFLTTELDFIPTQVEGDNDPISDIMEIVEFELSFDDNIKKDIISLIGILKSELLTLNLLENGNVEINCGEKTTHQSKIKIGNVDNKKKKAFNITINSEVLLNVLNIISPVEELPIIKFAENTPIIIDELNNAIWAINNMEGE